MAVLQKRWMVYGKSESKMDDDWGYPHFLPYDFCVQAGLNLLLWTMGTRTTQPIFVSTVQYIYIYNAYKYIHVYMRYLPSHQ